MVGCGPATPGNCGHWAMRKLASTNDSSGESRLNRLRTYLNGHNLHSSWVPPLPLPTFDTHGSQTKQTDCPISLTHLHTVEDFGHYVVVSIFGVDGALAEHRHVQRGTGREAIGRVIAYRRRTIRLYVVIFKFAPSIEV